ncbi:DMT family transporter [Dactylosporangium sp. AC04546]|uniref:DMT family transporter n=1 Tax=Dactylosporangium sp. AC04546 TaxID=2862460 RepID=UPI001EE01A0C|nr:DMT family transporter [Dactylosporangium sp. AC04546]WVK79142.1 DMT family transporter [Dactylosporangium sp. AC04546]
MRFAGLFACGALFGLSYVLVRDVVPATGPVGVTVVRTLIGGTALLLAARAAGQRPQWRRWRAYLVLGALSAAVPFSLISLSMLSLNAGTAAVLNASSPLFALGFARRRPTAGQLAGLALAISGVAVAMASRGLHLGDGGVVGVLAGLAGAAVFAYGGFFAARHFPDEAPAALAAGQQLAACLLLAPALLVLPVRAEPTGGLVLRLAVLGLAGSALAYLLFYRLVATEGPARAANVNLLVPLFGVLWGWVLLAEPVPPLSVAGMAATVAGLFLVLRAPAQRV